MDDDNRISITVCGDGGCGRSIFSRIKAELLILCCKQVNPQSHYG